MAIWTSRYSNKELQNGNYYCVGISLGTPKFPVGYPIRSQCYTLAPKRYMLQMDYEPYKAAYIQKLEDIGADKVVSMVMRLEEAAQEEGKELVLLCFEDVRNPKDWCHRTIFAEWYAEQTGEIIEELRDPSEPKGKKIESKQPEKKSEPQDSGYSQMSLFGTPGFAI